MVTDNHEVALAGRLHRMNVVEVFVWARWPEPPCASLVGAAAKAELSGALADQL